MNEFDKLFEEEMSKLAEGRFKSMATAGLMGLGALGGASNADATPNQPTTQVETEMRSTEQEVQKLEDLLKTLNKSDPLLRGIIHDLYKWEIAGNVKKIFKPYQDSEDKWTIGIGHLIKSNEDFSKGLTAEEVLALFNDDINERIRMAKNMFPQWESFPTRAKIALINGIYRGDIKRKHKTVELINSGQWLSASKEYLDHGDYRKSLAGNGRIASRMEENAKIFAFTAKVMR